MQSDTQTKQEMKPSTLALIFTSPAVLIIAATILVPFLYTVYLSLHKWQLKKRPPYDFIGLENYTNLLDDKNFWGSFQTTATFALLAVVFIVISGILIALLLNEDFPGRGILRGLLLVPWAIPAVVSGMLWKWLLDPSYGIINAMALQLGLIPKYQAWISEMPGALIWTVIAYSWIHIPLAALLLLSGLQTISGSLYEAAIVDGANMSQRFWRITLPLLRPTLTVVVIFETIFAFKVFDTIFVLTAGGPGRSTTVLGWKIYTETFKKLDFGEGSALALLLGAITMLIAIGFYAFLDKGVEQ
jgi:ABC-type sugar transport system permease subunit